MNTGDFKETGIFKKRIYTKGKRYKKRKKRTELFKSVLMAVLCLSFLFFGYKVVGIRKFIVPTALHTDSRAAENSLILNSEDAVNLYFEYTSPEYIMLSRDGGREVFYCDSEYYARAEKILKEVNKNIFMPDAEITEVTDASALAELVASNSLCASYAYRRYPKYSMQFLSGANKEFTNCVQSYKKLTVVPGESEKDGLSVYITDEKTEKTYKIAVSVPSGALIKMMGAVKETGTKKYVYAYELNFGKEPQSSGEIKTVGINPDILIPLTKLSKPKAEAKIPSVFANETPGGETAAEIAEIFGMNVGSLKQYIDKENTVVCVSESATLKIYSDGIVEYNASPANGGINLAGGTKLNAENSYFYSFTGVARIINSIARFAKNDEESVKLRLSELQSESTEVAEYKFMFDWYLEGIRVLTKPYHGAEASVSDGKLKFMRINLKQFNTGYGHSETELMLSAVDRYFANRPEDSRRSISGCELVYVLEKEDKEMRVEWNVY